MFLGRELLLVLQGLPLDVGVVDVRGRDRRGFLRGWHCIVEQMGDLRLRRRFEATASEETRFHVL